MSPEDPCGRTAPRVPVYGLVARLQLRVPVRSSMPVHFAARPRQSLVSDSCGVCHSVHAAKAPPLLAAAAPLAQACLTCHDGSGSSLDVAAQYLGTSMSARRQSPTTRRPEAITATTCWSTRRRRTPIRCRRPTSSLPPQPTQRVHRLPQCAQREAAHRPRRHSPAPPAPDGISGVAVTNGVAGAAPTYAFLDGGGGPAADSRIRDLPQVPFRVHEPGLERGQPPSRWVLDKAVELNPSTRPITPSRRPARTGPRQWRSASPGPRHTSSGTSRPAARSGASAAMATRRRLSLTQIRRPARCRPRAARQHEPRHPDPGLPGPRARSPPASHTRRQTRRCAWSATRRRGSSAALAGHELQAPPGAPGRHRRQGERRHGHRHAGRRAGQRGLRRVPLPHPRHRARLPGGRPRTRDSSISRRTSCLTRAPAC